MNKLYIGISGKMGSGKSTLTKGLLEAFEELKTEVVSMAKPIKDTQDMIYKSLGLEMEGEKDRPLLIALGMWGRDKDQNFWLDQAAKSMEKSDADIIICDDVRFENEADWFEKNGMLLRIEGEQRGPNVDESRAYHITETALDNHIFKYVVRNETVADTLTDTLYAIAQHLEVTEEMIAKADIQVRRRYGR